MRDDPFKEMSVWLVVAERADRKHREDKHTSRVLQSSTHRFQFKHIKSFGGFVRLSLWQKFGFTNMAE